MHQHTTAQCEPGDCLLLCCSHHCTQRRVCTACWHFSRHSLFCASSAVRQIQCTNKIHGSGWHWTQEEQHFQRVLQYQYMISLQSCQSSMPRMISYDLTFGFARILMSSQDQGEVNAVAQGLINDVDQDVCIMPSMLWLSEAVCCVRHELQQISNKEMESERERKSSCYCTWHRMISTSSYGTCISRP
jgi:hypothetical protein